MRGYYVKPIGSNRGKPRIWLQNLEVSAAGMAPGDRYDVHMRGGTVVLCANPDGSRKVSKAKTNNKDGSIIPIIDIESPDLLALFEGMSTIRIVQREGEIYLLPLASEIRKKERLNRVKQKVLSGLPLDLGSLSHGIGLLANAAHAGLEEAGLPSTNRMSNEIRPELLDHSSRQAGTWTSNTLTIAAPMQELAFDEAAMRHIPRIDVMEAGLPCSGASVAGRSRRHTANAEDHPDVGHLVVAALVILAKANPAVILLENVVPYASTASASILRNQLRDLGYVTHETVLKGEDFNALEHRNRWCMVAVTEGMHFDWSMLQLPEKKTLALSEMLDPVADDDPMWSEMKGLKLKQERDIAAGKNFLMQAFSGESTKIATITKGYAKVRSTDPKIMHPTDPDLLRQITPGEHARIKQYPDSIIKHLSATIAHEGLGQGVLRTPFVAAFKLLGESIINFANETRPGCLNELVDLMADEFTDTASMVVSELRAPLAGVKYEGPVTVSELGMVIQDMGNGVGVLHRSDALANVKLGEVLRVQYPRAKGAPKVEHLSSPAPDQTPALVQSIATAQQGLFDQPQAATPDLPEPELAPASSIYAAPASSIYKGPRM